MTKRAPARTNYGTVASPTCREALAAARDDGLALEDLAAAAGVDPFTVRRALLGENLTTPSFLALEAWAAQQREARHG